MKSLADEHSIKRRSRTLTHGARGLLGLGLAALVMGACGPLAGPADTGDELARLHDEHRELQAEISQLRTEVASLQTALGASTEAESLPTSLNARTDITPIEQSITLILEAYRESLESGDYSRIETQIYGGEVPREDARLYRAFIDNTDELRVKLEPGDIQIGGRSARVVVDHTMEYRLRPTREPRTIRVVLLMVFEQEGDAWRLTGIRRQ